MFYFPRSVPHQGTAALRLRSLDSRKQANSASTHWHGALLSDDTPHPQVAERAIKFGGTAISPPSCWCQPPMVGARRSSAMSCRDCLQQTNDSGFEARLILLKRPDRTETIRKTKHGGELGQSASARILEAKVIFKGSLPCEHLTTRVTRAMQDNATSWICSTRPQEFHVRSLNLAALSWAIQAWSCCRAVESASCAPAALTGSWTVQVVTAMRQVSCSVR